MSDPPWYKGCGFRPDLVGTDGDENPWEGSFRTGLRHPEVEGKGQEKSHDGERSDRGCVVGRPRGNTER